MATSKHHGGRPPKYSSVEDMQAVIDAYFTDCEGTPLQDADGNPVLYKGHPVMVGVKPPTVTGLALALGFASRQAMINYQGRKQFNDTITRAKARCEEYAEKRLYDRDGARGAQFSLERNFGWATANEQNPQQFTEDDPITKALKEEAGNGIL